MLNLRAQTHTRSKFWECLKQVVVIYLFRKARSEQRIREGRSENPHLNYIEAYVKSIHFIPKVTWGFLVVYTIGKIGIFFHI